MQDWLSESVKLPHWDKRPGSSACLEVLKDRKPWLGIRRPLLAAGKGQEQLSHHNAQGCHRHDGAQTHKAYPCSLACCGSLNPFSWASLRPFLPGPMEEEVAHTEGSTSTFHPLTPAPLCLLLRPLWWLRDLDSVSPCGNTFLCFLTSQGNQRPWFKREGCSFIHGSIH